MEKKTITMTQEEYKMIQKRIKILEDWIAEKDKIIEKKEAKITELRIRIGKIHSLTKI